MKISTSGALALMALAAPAAAQDTAVAGIPILGTDADDCRPGAKATAVLVTVIGFKDRDGRLRVQYYPDEKKDYLGSGRYIRRQEMPVTQAGDMQVCLTLPAPGSYVMVALHDRNSDGKLNVFSDGIGFSNNPRIPLGKPKLEKTRFAAGRGLTRLDVVLNYMQGLSPRPIKRD
ncbi:MAG: DUF2141 domain-containing protein [Polymorphobacter sp.]|uniref:DUF2141 domain-containing protein n=1 Tax=Polymorphobacter sp. TaxID=1909290 RepID=UPI003A89935D